MLNTEICNSAKRNKYEKKIIIEENLVVNVNDDPLWSFLNTIYHKEDVYNSLELQFIVTHGGNQQTDNNVHDNSTM